ncbi:MAG: bifunctional 5,10-methylenetetrahydrofolate dehydrogenase/5,10-methenyltetrahydrofolate cyclohydrolase, partial [Chthonomonas sp.]|nr:bifunctional 5,10-methylenetetrahydrofolate dehydrogenase/5,10-methenyltetrahydrofolate cyclohydrolase [Chthonomonas sp.]
VSQSLKESLAQRVALLREKGIVPRIEVVVAAQDPASVAYVRMKRKMAEALGMVSGAWEVSAATSQTELLAKIAELNADSAVHGVLVQHPLPGHLDEDSALAALGAEKDVDGITPQSLGLLVAGQRGFRSATPLGMMKLLDHYGLAVTGKHAVVIGRSVILGKPAALMLLERNATVTLAHSKTRDLPDLVRQADVLVAAVGRPELVQGDWIKPGAIVLDAGYNKVEGRTHDVGDCDFEGCAQNASWITPVPGGVGPMTIISLLANCVQAAEATMDGKSPAHRR